MRNMFFLTAFLSLPALPLTAAADSSDGRLDIYFIDVEGGAATLIVTPGGESLLIDSGFPDNNGRDLNRILTMCRQVGIEHIDHAAVTHWHRDHYGNHAALSTQISVGTFWDRGIPASLREDDQFENRIAEYRSATQNESKTLRAGDTLPLKSGHTPLSVHILTASREVIPNTGATNPWAKLHVPQDEDLSDNAASLSFLLRFGEFEFLCCGDLTWNIEAKLVTPNNPVGTVDLFMVTHHGLPNSNNPVLVRAVDPLVAVMCNGPAKGGHPGVIKTLRQVDSLQDLYQLHRNMDLEPEEQAPAAFIANHGTTTGCHGIHVEASVAPNGQNFRVRIGTEGTLRDYATH